MYLYEYGDLMAIDRFFNKTVTQKRKGSSTGATNEAWGTVSTTVRCCIFPVNPGDALAFNTDNIRLNISHNMFCFSSVSILVDDQIIDGSDEYIVRLPPKKWGDFNMIYLSEVDL